MKTYLSFTGKKYATEQLILAYEDLEIEFVQENTYEKIIKTGIESLAVIVFYTFQINNNKIINIQFLSQEEIEKIAVLL